LFDAVNVIVEPVGAKSGTLSQVAVRRDAAMTRHTPISRAPKRFPATPNAKRGIIKTLTILVS
jgi:hypothetical protein